MLGKQREILAQVLPAYATAAARGSVELSATPYYHPDSAVAVRHQCGANRRRD